MNTKEHANLVARIKNIGEGCQDAVTNLHANRVGRDDVADYLTICGEALIRMAQEITKESS